MERRQGEERESKKRGRGTDSKFPFDIKHTVVYAVLRAGPGKVGIQAYGFSSINLALPVERDEAASYRDGMDRQRGAHISHQQQTLS